MVQGHMVLDHKYIVETKSPKKKKAFRLTRTVFVMNLVVAYM